MPAILPIDPPLRYFRIRKILLYIPLVGTGGRSPFLKIRQFLTITTDTGKHLLLTLTPELHLFVAVGASGVGGLCQTSAIAAFAVRAHQHLTPFPFDPEQVFPAVRTRCSGLIIMLIAFVTRLDFCNKL